MLPDTGFRGRIVGQLVMTILWLGCSQAAVALRGVGLHSNAQSTSLPVVRVTLQENSTSPAGDQGSNGSDDDAGLSSGVLTGIIVGSVLGGVFVAAAICLLVCYLRRRKASSSNQEKPKATPETKTSSSSAWSCFRKKNVKSGGKARLPPIFGSDKQDPGDISDTSFVLPELGGPNPHNKFDGMEWVDIKGLDNDTLIDISTDLRKYQQGR